MSIEAGGFTTAALRVEELQKENEQLRDQVRRYAAHQTVSQGALREATHEKEATSRIASQVTAEERATRAAVEVQGSSLSAGLVLQCISFLLMVVMVCGLYFWLPAQLENRLRPASTTLVTPSGAGRVVIPTR